MTHRIALALGALLLIWNCASNQERTAVKIEPITSTTSTEVEMVSREAWGSVALTDTIPTHKIKYITIHHGGEYFAEDKDVMSYLRGLQSWSRSEKNWIDNPYHYMIDLKGTIYETRPIQYPGDTNTSYDVRGHALICVMGNYEDQILSETQFEQLARLTASLADQYEVSGELIKTHKDYVETLCPGKDLYRYFEDGSFLIRVAELRK